jgi:hypothetical protein
MSETSKSRRSNDRGMHWSKSHRSNDRGMHWSK